MNSLGTINLVHQVENGAVASPESTGWDRRFRHYHLLSLWQILRFHARPFVAMINAFSQTERDLDGIPQNIGEIDHPGVRAEFERLNSMVLKALDNIEPRCKQLSLNSSVLKIQRIRSQVPMKPSALQSSFKEMKERIEDELESRLFFFIPTERASYFDEAPAFGEGVRSKQPSINYFQV